MVCVMLHKWGWLKASSTPVWLKASTPADPYVQLCSIAVCPIQTMKRRDLLVAQPSNCRGDDSDNPYWWAGQHAGPVVALAACISWWPWPWRLAHHL